MKLRIYRVADTDLRNGQPGAGALQSGDEEVVRLADVERAIDEREDKLRDQAAYRRALVGLISTIPGYLPGDPLHLAVLRLVEEVEHLRQRKDEEEVVVEERPRVSATLRQWVEEERIHLRQLAARSTVEQHRLEGEKLALQRVAERIDEEAARS